MNVLRCQMQHEGCRPMYAAGKRVAASSEPEPETSHAAAVADGSLSDRARSQTPVEAVCKRCSPATPSRASVAPRNVVSLPSQTPPSKRQLKFTPPSRVAQANTHDRSCTSSVSVLAQDRRSVAQKALQEAAASSAAQRRSTTSAHKGSCASQDAQVLQVLQRDASASGNRSQVRATTPNERIAPRAAGSARASKQQAKVTARPKAAATGAAAGGVAAPAMVLRKPAAHRPVKFPKPPKSLSDGPISIEAGFEGKSDFLSQQKAWAAGLVADRLIHVRHQWYAGDDGFRVMLWCNSCQKCQSHQQGWSAEARFDFKTKCLTREYTPLSAHGDFDHGRKWNPLERRTEAALQTFVESNRPFTKQDLLKIAEEKQPGKTVHETFLHIPGVPTIVQRGLRGKKAVHPSTLGASMTGCRSNVIMAR